MEQKIYNGVIEKQCVDTAEMPEMCATTSLQLLTALSREYVDFRPRGNSPTSLQLVMYAGGVSNA
jgi:hypothetical protein